MKRVTEARKESWVGSGRGREPLGSSSCCFKVPRPVPSPLLPKCNIVSSFLSVRQLAALTSSAPPVGSGAEREKMFRVLCKTNKSVSQDVNERVPSFCSCSLCSFLSQDRHAADTLLHDCSMKKPSHMRWTFSQKCH